MSYDNILYEAEGPLALITINRPGRHNAISLATLDDLHAAIERAARDEAIRVIAITGAGDKAFASGSDLEEVERRDLAKALEPLVQGVAERLERTPKPTIAAINGICMGGGLEVALGCDLRIAARGARFATPEGKLGIIPGGGATQRLPRIVGRGWALEMLLMGEEVDAESALQIGLVTRLVEAEELIRASLRFDPRLQVANREVVRQTPDFWMSFYRTSYDVHPEDGRVLFLSTRGSAASNRIRVVLDWSAHQERAFASAP